MRMYTASIRITALTTAKTLLYITVATGKLVTLFSAAVTNATNETNEQLELSVRRITTLGTPTGTAITPTKHDSGDAAAGATVVGNVTGSEPTYSSAPAEDLGYQGVASLSGWYFPATPLPLQALPRFTSGQSWGIKPLATVASLDVVVSIVFGEEG